MRTFIINELRENAKGEKFPVQTKMQFKSVDVLIQHLKANPNILWNGEYVITEDQRKKVTKKWGKNCG